VRHPVARQGVAHQVFEQVGGPGLVGAFVQPAGAPPQRHRRDLAGRCRCDVDGDAARICIESVRHCKAPVPTAARFRGASIAVAARIVPTPGAMRWAAGASGVVAWPVLGFIAEREGRWRRGHCPTRSREDN
jgi:hypothetical protein